MGITTTTAIALAAIAASTAVTTYGVIQQGKNAEKVAKYQAAVYNQQADQERDVAAANEEDYRRRQHRLIAASRAAAGGSGLDTSTGSPLLAAEDFAAETELQALRVRAGGDITASRLEEQAALTRATGQSARQASYIQAGGALLKGIGRSSLLIGNPKLAAIS